MTPEEIKDRLRQVKYPGFSRDIVSFGLVRSAEFSAGKVRVALSLTSTDPAVPRQLQAEAERCLRGLPGVKEVTVEVAVQAGGRTAAAAAPKEIRHAVAVASGKGGVGKTTVAVNLACALEGILAAAGRPGRIGLLDCDIYGPSVPLMMGLDGRPEIEGDGPSARLVPMEKHGVKVMSMGFLVDDDTPVVWRGPMVMKTIQQFVQNVRWGPLEVLVVDLPPGTGDAQLSLVQTLPLDGAILVTTPQPAAFNVARKGGLMFQKVNVPLLGVVENMSWFADPSGARHALFGAGGGAVAAERLGAELLAQVPLVPEIREGGDRGRPIAVDAPQSAAAAVFRGLAEALLARLARAGPAPGGGPVAFA